MTTKGTIIALVVFLLSAGLLFGVFANSHIEIFPGIVRNYDYTLEMETTHYEMISLLDHLRPDEEHFTVGGYIVAFLVIFLLPAVGSYFLGKKIGKKD